MVRRGRCCGERGGLRSSAEFAPSAPSKMSEEMTTLTRVFKTVPTTKVPIMQKPYITPYSSWFHATS
jgi:hypothetical protein